MDFDLALVFFIFHVGMLVMMAIIAGILLRMEDRLGDILHEQHRLRGGAGDYNLYDIWNAVDMLDDHILDAWDAVQNGRKENELSGDSDVSE